MPYGTLAETLRAYRPCNAQETAERAALLGWMEQFDDLLLRSNLLAHFTASSIILDETGRFTLLVYHNLYDSWGWTGGHADGDADLLAVALREAQEETGADCLPLSAQVLGIDCLPVWGHIKRGFYVPSHLHLNLTYLLRADRSAPLRAKPDENKAVRWFALEELETVCREAEMKPVYHKLVNRAKEWLR